ncbi:2-oxoglutarate and iron-dependent oxygenase domain-containing protein [Nannocystis sp.]|uniref:isopenicillin N synthase family dioxygenase n=1 Tax=Nannocystis sp. TaxID=1962667 RepID=UPI0025F98791|nr:2-oxoglutarate and iron-dependent oxygenase domain-containing protein [Nannocystis sp.]MBK7825236.1 isopenicillin N synthase family oxygenase [Nannocystis sp.]
MPAALPIVDMSPLLRPGPDAEQDALARAIATACRERGFFYVVGHGVDPDLLAALDLACRQFFALPAAAKQAIAMARGGRAWRGYFALGDELTAGVPDLKEGLYFGSELGPEHPRVRAGVPLHGANLFPLELPALRPAVLAYIDALTRVAHALLRGVARSLGLADDYFAVHYTADPTVLFRVFHYPAVADAAGWGVGEHTDYGLLTLLAQDEVGGLEVKTPDGWIDAPPISGAMICNLGDMLDRLTGGEYRSTPHRVRSSGGRSRLSFPFFFDPDFTAELRPLPDRPPRPDDAVDRWDRSSVHAFTGSYGDYLLAKVARVFPALVTAT